MPLMDDLDKECEHSAKIAEKQEPVQSSKADPSVEAKIAELQEQTHQMREEYAFAERRRKELEDENIRLRSQRRLRIGGHLAKLGAAAALILLAYGGITHGWALYDETRTQKKITKYHHEYALAEQGLQKFDVSAAQQALSQLEQELLAEKPEVSSKFDLAPLKAKLHTEEGYARRLDQLQQNLASASCNPDMIGRVNSDLSQWRVDVGSDSEAKFILSLPSVMELDAKVKAEPKRCEDARQKRIQDYKRMYESIDTSLKDFDITTPQSLFKKLQEDLASEDKTVSSLLNLEELNSRIKLYKYHTDKFSQFRQRLDGGNCTGVEQLINEFGQWKSEAGIRPSGYIPGERTIILSSKTTNLVTEFEARLNAEPERCRQEAERKNEAEAQKRIKGYDSSYSAIQGFIKGLNPGEARKKLGELRMALKGESNGISSNYDLDSLDRLVQAETIYLGQVQGIAGRVGSASCQEADSLQAQLSALTNAVNQEPGFPKTEFFKWNLYKDTQKKIKDKLGCCNFKPNVFLEKGGIYVTEYGGGKRELIRLNSEIAAPFGMGGKGSIIKEFKVSPDNKHIVFVGSELGMVTLGSSEVEMVGANVYIIDIEGTNFVNITHQFEVLDSRRCRYFTNPFWVGNNTLGVNMENLCSSYNSDIPNGTYKIGFDTLNQPTSFEPYREAR